MIFGLKEFITPSCIYFAAILSVVEKFNNTLDERFKR